MLCFIPATGIGMKRQKKWYLPLFLLFLIMKTAKYILPLFIIMEIVLTACWGDSHNQSPDSLKTQAVIDSAIMVHGGKNYEELNLAFDFRDIHYTARRDKGKFTYTRTFTDSLQNQVRDVLNNKGLYREVNGERVSLTEERNKAYRESVNSVIYFALLPYGLNDPAVIKEYLGEAKINGEPYHKIKITFQEEGGGEDHEDVYIYWIHKERYTMDYLAYSFHVNGGGMRFRKAFNDRMVQGIRFSDYENFKPPSDSIPLLKLDSLFERGELREVSVIGLENLKAE